MLALAAVTLVVCAPGSPGSTAEAQPAMDALATSMARAAQLPQGSVHAVYDEAEPGCLQHLKERDAGLLLATLPFLLGHEQELKLAPRLSAMPQGGEPLERWTLVAGKDHPASLQGYTIQSTAGYSKRFVRAMVPNLPAGVTIEPVTAVLSSLRRAANGEKVAVLLDGTQASGMSSLPFASSLTVVGSSPPMPVAVVATVGKRVSDEQWQQLEGAFLRLAEDKSARSALDGVRMAGFVPLDETALAAARNAYRRAK